MNIFNKINLKKTNNEIREERNDLIIQIGELEKNKLNLENDLKLKYLEKEQRLIYLENDLNNNIKLFEQNKSNFLTSCKIETDILKEQIKFMQDYKMVLPEAKMIPEGKLDMSSNVLDNYSEVHLKK